MVCGTWMTLGTVVPDYAQRMTTPKSVTLGVLVILPAFAAAAALVGLAGAGAQPGAPARCSWRAW